MSKNIDRRDFLKMMGALSLGTMGYPFIKWIQPDQPNLTGKKNILLMVFDAFSAQHISFHGYTRATTPNLVRLMERAVIYHNHYAGGNFTTPGTASLLTGVLPWKHRAFDFFQTVDKAFADKSIFHAFSDYYRLAYSHNPLVVKLLDQFSSGLDENIPLDRFLLSNDNIIQKLFLQDKDIAAVGWARTIKKEDEYSYSLYLSSIYKQIQDNKLKNLTPQFPRGLPSINGDNHFTLEMVMDWLGLQIPQIPQPFLGYFHFIPPHQPYSTHAEFYNRFFNDRFTSADKPEDIFSKPASVDLMLRRRQQYDEFILYVDREFGRLFDRLETAGLLENTWVILTSDHGELFERGIIGHVTPVLYEPVVHVPLMIFEPGRTTRLDVYDKTSVVDILPTLLHITGAQTPDWTDGTVLPPFGKIDKVLDQNIYIVQSKDTELASPITKATIVLIKGNYKLMYFAGYEELNQEERIELYDLAQDPDEINNIYSRQSGMGNLMLEELKSKLAEVNQPYINNS